MESIWVWFKGSGDLGGLGGLGVDGWLADGCGAGLGESVCRMSERARGGASPSWAMMEGKAKRRDVATRDTTR